MTIVSQVLNVADDTESASLTLVETCRKMLFNFGEGKCLNLCDGNRNLTQKDTYLGVTRGTNLNVSELKANTHIYSQTLLRILVYCKKDIAVPERILRMATQTISALRQLSYEDGLEQFEFTTLEIRDLKKCV